MDHNVPRSIIVGLRLRRVDVITAYEDGSSELSDSDLLDRTSELGRVLFTQDDDLLAEASKRHRDNIPFHGVIYAHQLKVSIGTCIENLEIISQACEIEEMLNRVEFLPL
jgi:hypothetical protein